MVHPFALEKISGSGKDITNSLSLYCFYWRVESLVKNCLIPKRKPYNKVINIA